jgi:hypothetical protein
MKIKSDFITNSSSASYILYIESSAKNLNEFKMFWKKYQQFYIDSYRYRLDQKIKEYRKILKKSWKKKLEIDKKVKNGTASEMEKIFNLMREPTNPKDLSDDELLNQVLDFHTNIELIVGNVYSVEYFTSMHNDLDDIPKWMKELIILNNMKSPELMVLGFKDVRLEIKKDN